MEPVGSLSADPKVALFTLFACARTIGLSLQVVCSTKTAGANVPDSLSVGRHCFLHCS